MANIPRNIDLTANHDFGRDGRIIIPALSIDTLLDEEISTSDEYELVARHESIFGKRRYRSQVNEAFGPLFNIPFESENWNRICVRCGRFLFPWNNLGGICRECDNQLNQSYGPLWDNIPWHRYDTPRLPNRVMDIFDLR